jgi:hypothetical protein
MKVFPIIRKMVPRVPVTCGKNAENWPIVLAKAEKEGKVSLFIRVQSRT